MSEHEINKKMDDCILLEALLIEENYDDMKLASKKVELVEQYQKQYGTKIVKTKEVVNGVERLVITEVYTPIPPKQQLEMLEEYYVWAEKEYTEKTGKGVLYGGV